MVKDNSLVKAKWEGVKDREEGDTCNNTNIKIS